MFNAKTFIVSFVASAILVAVAVHVLSVRMEVQQKEIDHLYDAMPDAITWDKKGEVERLDYKSLPADRFTLHFANLKERMAIVEHNSPGYDSMESLDDSPNHTYAYIFDIPEEILSNWTWLEVRRGPSLKE
jgi:hypothetical protein